MGCQHQRQAIIVSSKRRNVEATRISGQQHKMPETADSTACRASKRARKERPSPDHAEDEKWGGLPGRHAQREQERVRRDENPHGDEEHGARCGEHQPASRDCEVDGTRTATRHAACYQRAAAVRPCRVRFMRPASRHYLTPICVRRGLSGRRPARAGRRRCGLNDGHGGGAFEQQQQRPRQAPGFRTLAAGSCAIWL
jgi:hypothetical protein